LIAMLSLAGALAADPAPTPPRVRVVAARDAVADWLVGRLLEEGYTVTGAADAQIDLTLARADRSWELRADGATSERISVPIDDDEAVARLELLHLAVDVLASVQPRVSETSAVGSFAIELAPVFAPVLHTAIEAELARAVLDSGAALAPVRPSASFVLCASFVDGAVDVAARPASEPCPAVASHTTVASVREQAALAIAATLHPAPPEPVMAVQATDAERAPLGAAPPQPSEPPPTWTDAPLVLRGGASAGVITRGLEPDGVVATSIFVGREPGVSAWLDVQIWPGARTIGDLFVLEVLPAAGMRVRAFTRGRISLDVGGLLGIQAHGYRIGQGDRRGRGIAFDASAEGAIGIAVALWNEHELHLLARGGLTTRDRRHVVEENVLWQRESWRFGTTLGLTFGRRLRR
jgi:hypothetical protein